jgi:predicted phosphate transport protein (TIGR00153 family)
MVEMSQPPGSLRQQVDSTIRLLFALVAESVGWATIALLDQNVEAANDVISGDEAFDERCNELTAMIKARLSEAPLPADEVETLVTMLQIVPELERSADLAEHIAQRSLGGLGGLIPPLSRGLVQSISDTVIQMWKLAGDEYGNPSRQAGTSLDAADGELDELCASLITEGMGGVDDSAIAVNLALIARFYERLGDHAVNLARRVDSLAAPRRLTPLSSWSSSAPLVGKKAKGRRWKLLGRVQHLRFAPRDDRFFDLFELAANNARDCAVELQKVVTSFSDIDEHCHQIKEYERRGDQITVESLRLLDASFVTPFDREDIHALVEELDDVVDEMFSAGSLLQLVQVETPLPEAVELAELLTSMADELVALIRSLRGGEGARYRLERIEQLEHHGDTIYRSSIERLFGGNYEAIEILKWKDIVHALESSANAIEDVSDVVESILVKGS